MTTLDQVAFNILNQVRGGRSTNNDLLSLEQIKYWVKYYRALLIRRDESSISSVDSLAQRIPVLISTTAETWGVIGQVNPVPGAAIPSKTHKSLTQLPEIIRLKLRLGIQNVLFDDSVTKIPYMNERRSQWNQYNKYTSGATICWIADGYLYVSGTDFTGATDPQVFLEALFADPEEAFNYSTAVTTPWSDTTDSFPITSDLIQTITQSILNGEAKVSVESPNDEQLDLSQ